MKSKYAAAISKKIRPEKNNERVRVKKKSARKERVRGERGRECVRRKRQGRERGIERAYIRIKIEREKGRGKRRRGTSKADQV